LSHYNGNYFDATDPEDRNNWQLAGSTSYFVTTDRLGSHDFKAGFEVYQGNRTGGNSQTATGYVFTPTTSPAVATCRCSMRRAG
jgi:hypothetical protein